jgi:hypothetical protein
MASLEDFLDTADQFLIRYSVPPALIPVSLFEIGHAIELYLKATKLKLTGDVDEAISDGHKIRDIWGYCKSHDANFMPHYELRDSILSSDFIHDAGASLSPEDQTHYLENQEFYIIAKHLLDIKYIGTTFKTLNKSKKYSVWGMIDQNPYWLAFLKELRHYLGWPTSRRRDWIKFYIDEQRIPPSAAKYLGNLYK